jgi:hypothetical protein
VSAGSPSRAARNAEDRLLISAGTVTDPLIVAGTCGIEDVRVRFVESPGFEIVPVAGDTAKCAATRASAFAQGREIGRAQFRRLLLSWRRSVVVRFSMSAAISSRRTSEAHCGVDAAHSPKLEHGQRMRGVEAELEGVAASNH